MSIHPVPARRLAPLFAALCLSACSPYLYKAEVAGFQAAVTDVNTAYVEGRRRLADDRLAARHWDWTGRGAGLAPSAGCILTSVDTVDGEACVLIEAGHSTRVHQTDLEIANAQTQVKALSDYADALAAITNAADREALAAAQGSLATALEGATKVAGGDPAQLSAVSGFLMSAHTAFLDHRRYEALRRSVLAAEDPVATIAAALGENLEAIRQARGSALGASTAWLSQTTGTPVGASSLYAQRLDAMGVGYHERLAALQAGVAANEALRRGNPKAAAADLAKAHAALAAALRDNGRQTTTVLVAMQDFADSAKALRETLAAGG